MNREQIQKQIWDSVELRVGLTVHDRVGFLVASQNLDSIWPYVRRMYDPIIAQVRDDAWRQIRNQTSEEHDDSQL
jgi:hypothetical protein